MPSSTSIYSKEPSDINDEVRETPTHEELNSDLRSDTPPRTPSFTVDSARSLGLQLSFVYDTVAPAPVRSYENSSQNPGKFYDDTGGRVLRLDPSDAAQLIQ